MDGNPSDSGGRYRGVFAGRDANTVPVNVEGRTGGALQFGNGTVLEVPIDLDPKTIPVVTFAFWIQRLSRLPTKDEVTIVSTGGDAPRVTMSNGHLKIKAGEQGVRVNKALAPDAWHFVAITWNSVEGSVTVYQDNSEAYYDLNYKVRYAHPPYLSPRDPDAQRLGDEAKKPYMWIGAENGFHFAGSATGVVLDDLRIFSGQPTPEQLSQLSGGRTDGVSSAGQQVGWRAARVDTEAEP